MSETGFTALAGAPNTLDADFEATMSFRSSADAVFDAITTSLDLSNWWMQASGFGLAGGELTFVFGDDSLVIRVDKAERPSVVQWTAIAISSEPLQDWVGTTIGFEVSSNEHGGSQLQFRHTGMSPRLECFDTCSMGWRRHLASLVRYVDSGQGDPFGSTSA